MGPTPVVGDRSVSTAVQENVMDRGFGRATKKKKKRPFLRGYRQAFNATSKTPETTVPAPHGGIKHLTQY